ncbi:hypothetical protein BDF14DRAFT_1725080 [Spinellus fusiger]|nr:hypothetical protein BDF14DRAFT_1725080 [Spinellus fusiger]
MSKRPCSPSSYYPPRHSRPYTSGIHTFPVYPPRSYTGRPPNYRQPVEINSYSIDHQRQVWFDNRELKYFYPPNGKDLFSGYDAFVQRDESLKEHLDTLLDALTDAQQKSEDPNLTRVDIVTWRGIMTKILCTPFTKNEPWILRATKHKNAIYIEEEQTEEKRIREDILPIRQQLLCYSGYRFETLCTLSKPPSQIEKEDPELKQRLNDSANTNIQYCVLVKTKIGNTSLIMGAEVDCCKGILLLLLLLLLCTVETYPIDCIRFKADRKQQ